MAKGSLKIHKNYETEFKNNDILNYRTRANLMTRQLSLAGGKERYKREGSQRNFKCKNNFKHVGHIQGLGS